MHNERRGNFIQQRLDDFAVVAINIAVGLASRWRQLGWLGKAWREDAFREAKHSGRVRFSTTAAIWSMGRRERVEGLREIEEGKRTHDSLKRLKQFNKER